MRSVGFHRDRPVTIPELTQALRVCHEVLARERQTVLTLRLEGLIQRAEEQGSSLRNVRRRRQRSRCGRLAVPDLRRGW